MRRYRKKETARASTTLIRWSCMIEKAACRVKCEEAMNHELIYFAQLPTVMGCQRYMLVAPSRIEQYGITTWALNGVIRTYQIIRFQSFRYSEPARSRARANNYVIKYKNSHINGHKSASFGSCLVN